MGRPLSLDDELDALLDAPPSDSGRVSAELRPLVAVATALRAELATVVVDPGVARRHLSHAIGMPRLGPLQLAGAGHSGNGSGLRIGTDVPVRPRLRPTPRREPSPLRRRVAAIALAAALLLIPATMLSGRSLPGQPLYPLKLSVEDVRLAALGWSPAGTARERLRIADVRLAELTQLTDSGQLKRVPDAVLSLRAAVDSAAQAVDQAWLQEVDSGRAVALRQDLDAVQQRQIVHLTAVAQRLPNASPAAQEAREAAQNALVSAKQQRRSTQSTTTTTPPPSSG
ncbi:MAG TPA: DUF5667 domain-containing protein [Actinomycetes bacterium]